MKPILIAALAGAFALVTVHAADVGTAAPLFTAKDTKGATVSLAELRGKVVVLEWVSFGCPFVNKHYGSGNMQKLQADYTGKGVVWMTVSSVGEANASYVAPAKFSELGMPSRFTKPGSPCWAGPSMRKSGAGLPGPWILGRTPL